MLYEVITAKKQVESGDKKRQKPVIKIKAEVEQSDVITKAQIALPKTVV